MAETYVIGQGVKDAMAAASDEPRSDEEYHGGTAAGGAQYSITQGRDAQYRWTPEDGVKRSPFGDADDPDVPVREVSAIDVSSHQGKDLTALLDQYDPEHVIMKAYQSIELGGGGADYTIRQTRGALAHGCTVGYYIWLYASGDGGEQAARGIRTILAAAAYPSVEAFHAAVIWLDCESYTDGSDPGPEVIRAAVAEVERQGCRAGIYTGRWWLIGHYPGGELAFGAEFGRLPLWLSQYDNDPDLSTTHMPAGYPRESLAGKQYTGNPIDRSTMLSSVTDP